MALSSAVLHSPISNFFPHIIRNPASSVFVASPFIPASFGGEARLDTSLQNLGSPYYSIVLLYGMRATNEKICQVFASYGNSNIIILQNFTVPNPLTPLFSPSPASDTPMSCHFFPIRNKLFSILCGDWPAIERIVDAFERTGKRND